MTRFLSTVLLDCLISALLTVAFLGLLAIFVGASWLSIAPVQATILLLAGPVAVIAGLFSALYLIQRSR